MNEELKSEEWVKVMDQPAVRIMKLILEEKGASRKGRHIESEEGEDRKTVKTHCVTDLPMSKQQELVEASFQMRCRIFEFSASFAAIPLESIPLGVDYVEALSHQEVPDHFAGLAMAKTITQETRVVFGPEQEEWKAAILAELLVYVVVSRADVRGQEILPGRLVLVAKPNPEGEKGKKKARIAVCGNFQTVHQDEVTSSKTPSAPMLRMLLSLASYQGWPIEQYIYMRPPRVIEKLGLLPEGTIWKLKKALYGLRTSPLAWEVERDNTLAQLQWEIEDRWYGLVPAKGNPCLWAIVELDAENSFVPVAANSGHKDKAGHLCCPWHLRFHDGEDPSDSCISFGRDVEVCWDDSNFRNVHSFSGNGPNKLQFRRSTRSPTWK